MICVPRVELCVLLFFKEFEAPKKMTREIWGKGTECVECLLYFAFRSRRPNDQKRVYGAVSLLSNATKLT